jgi:N6-adenosine-specific RNA methylase IME4
VALFGTKGRPKRTFKDVPKLLIAPVREHSRKPDEMYGRCERLLHGLRRAVRPAKPQGLRR